MLPAPTVTRFACPAELTRVELTLPDGSTHTVTLPPCAADEEHRLAVGGQPVILRRVYCTIAEGLLRDDQPNWQLAPQARAALLWRAYKRYDQLVGLKRLSGGLSGSAVLVFRPRLRAPTFDHTSAMATAGPTEVLAEAWGSPLLVKTGRADLLQQEWQRSDTFLRDRQSPYIVQNEEPLEIRPVGALPAGNLSHATMISSFLGGSRVQAEPLDKLIRGSRDAAPALRAIEAVIGHLATWHTNPRQLPLAEWSRTFRFPDSASRPGAPAANSADPWLLFGQYNFHKRNADEKTTWDLPRQKPLGGPSLGRAEFARGVAWDIAFGSTPHLKRHLLGTGTVHDGLLHKLAAVPALFSLVHGDLNPRNVLCDPDKVWLIDFQHTGAGPILADLAKLEVNLRLWCIDLGQSSDGAAQAARQLERFLLDHFQGSESSLEPVRKLARSLGADPDELEKVVRCVLHVRQLARRWCVPQFTDGRDYLALLYLTNLSLLPYAGRGHTGPANERWAVELSWVLEHTLDRLLDRVPFDRGHRTYDPLRHVSAELVRAPDAPRRIDYLCSTTDGQLALQPVVALRGVLQGNYHHLDAYQHTLSVLAYVEALLDDPIGGLLDPAKLDTTVAGRLREYGLSVPPPVPDQVNPPCIEVPWFPPHRDRLLAFLHETLTDDARLVLKWCAVLHDVGKPGTRTLRDREGDAEVQFLGHERYGPALLGAQLAAWFPGPQPETDPVSTRGRRLETLMHNHHQSHHLIGGHFLVEAGRAAELFELLGGESHPRLLAWLRDRSMPGTDEYRPDLPLLLLHGFADRMSARGVRQGGTVSDWAAVTLALLTYLACEGEFADAESRREERATAAERAALEYANELRDHGQIPAKDFGRAMSVLKEACGGRPGTQNELLLYLREQFNGAALLERLRARR